MPPGLSLCVALCAYNGAAYLREQLDSIFQQTRLPDRMMVVDDCSSDDTVRIVRDFAASAPFPIDIVENTINLGYAKNFDKAVGLCSADVIVLCDQDDVWHHDKLAKIEAYLTAHPEVDAVFSDAEVVSQERRPLGYSLWDSIHFSERERRWIKSGASFRVLLRRNVVTGATMAFRARVKSMVLPIPQEWVHDEWIAIVIAATGRLGFIPERLIQYRQHDANQIGARRLTFTEQIHRLFTKRDGFRRKLHLKTKLLRGHLVGLPEGAVAAGVIKELDGKVLHVAFRAGLPGARVLRLGPVAGELLRGRYLRYSNGLKTPISDLLEPF